MSQAKTPPDGDRDEWLNFIETHRDRIEAAAESDAPDAWVYNRLLNYADSEGDS